MGCCLGNRDESIDDDLYGCNTIDELISAINQQLQNLKREEKEITDFFSTNNTNFYTHIEYNNMNNLELKQRKKFLKNIITTLEYTSFNLKKKEDKINFNKVFPMINNLFFIIKSKVEPNNGIKNFYNEFNEYIKEL